MLARLKTFFVDLIGRKQLGCKATIPAALERAFDLWPDGDQDLALLT